MFCGLSRWSKSSRTILWLKARESKRSSGENLYMNSVVCSTWVWTVPDSVVPLEQERTHSPAQWPHTMCRRPNYYILAVIACPAQQLLLGLVLGWMVVAYSHSPGSIWLSRDQTGDIIGTTIPASFRSLIMALICANLFPHKLWYCFLLNILARWG